MNKKSVVKILITLILCVSVLMCSGVSAFAYYPILNIESDEWDIQSDMTYSAVYPNRINEFAYADLDDKCFSYSDLDGQTYYGSCYWRDDYPYLTESDITIPAFPADSSGAFGNDLSDCNKFIFRLGNTLYLAFFFGCTLGYDETGILYYQSTAWAGEIDVYTLSYPYSSWTYYGFYDWYDISDRCSIGFGNNLNDTFSDVWSDVDIYDSSMTSVLHSADSNDIQGTAYTLEYEKPLSVLTGTLSFELSASELKFLSCGACCIRFDDFGVIAGTYTSFLYSAYYLTAYDSSGSAIATTRFLSGDDCDVSLEAGDKLIDDSVVFADFAFEDYDYSDYTIELTFVFVSDGYNLFFPGTFEIIEFESYESDMEHQEVLDSISNASSVISGEISSASSNLSKEIVNAASDIKTAVNDSSAEIVTSVDNASAEITEELKNVTDSVNNASDKISGTLEDVGDNITEKLEDTKNSVLEGIKSFFIPSEEIMTEIKDKWSELLKSRFGALYEVSDIIADFASELNWEYVKAAGEKNTITMPSVTVKLGDTDFTFGGYEVSIIPEGFDVLVTALKGIISIVCTLLFINALRNKYESLIGGEVPKYYFTGG